jgi:hypothetical protein
MCVLVQWLARRTRDRATRVRVSMRRTKLTRNILGHNVHSTVSRFTQPGHQTVRRQN